jgi:hypothetical protein
MSAGTSLFSDRTRRRWELAEQQVRASSDQAPHAGGMLLRQTRRLQGIGREGVRMGHLPHGQPAGLPHGQLDGRPEGQAECWPGQATANASAGARNALVRATGRRNSYPYRNGNWSNAQLQGALRVYDHGTSVNGAAAMFDIPRTTVRVHLAGTVLSRKRGAAPVLTDAEEQQLVQYLISMQNLDFPLTISQLKLKVAMITQGRDMPFTNGIPGPGWLRWFRRRHPELSLRLAQGLDSKRARSLSAVNVNSFYENLSCLYDAHNYSPFHIWNCDETGVQAGHNGGAYVLAKTGTRSVHQVVPNEREWLTCINAAGESIPNFYIFRGKRF